MTVTRQEGEIVLDSKRYKLRTPVSWQRQPVVSTPRKIGSGDTKYSDYNLWNVKAWDTWHLGKGEEYFETDGRFFDSLNCETRIKRQITLGPRRNPTSLSTADGLVYDGGTSYLHFSLGWSSASIYAVAGSFVVPSGGLTADKVHLYIKRIGTSPVDITVALYTDSAGSPGTAVTGATKTLTASSFSTEYTWVVFDWTGTVALTSLATYWIVASVASLSSTVFYRILTDTSAGNPDGNCKISKASPWSWTDYSSTNDLLFYLEGTQAQMSGLPLKFAVYNDNGTTKLFCLAGSKVYYWDGTNNLWVDDSATITGEGTDMVVFDDKLCVAQGTTSYIQAKSAGVWGDLFTLTNRKKAHKLGLGIMPDGTHAGYTMLMATGPTSGTDRHIVQCVTWGESTWRNFNSDSGQQLNIGDSSSNITWMGLYQADNWICKEDGIWQIGLDGYPYLKFPFTSQKYSTNFDGSTIWHNNELMLPAMYGLWSFDGYTLKNIGPGVSLRGVGAEGQHVGLPTERQGMIRGLLPAVNALYACIDGGATQSRYSSIILWTGLGWHEVVRGDVGNNRILALGYTAAGTVEAEARLWYGYGNQIYYMILPDTTDEPYQWADSQYEKQGWVEFGWYDAGLRAVDKDWREVRVEAENVNASQTVEILYKLDDDTSWTSLGLIDDGTEGTAIANNEATLTFGTNTYGKQLKLKLLLATADPEETPKVTAVILKYWQVPDVVWGWQYSLALTDPLDRSWRTQYTDFIATYEGKEPVTVVDVVGASYTVRLDRPVMTPIASETGAITGWLVSGWAYEA